MEDYLHIELGSSFLMNAGILGLVRFLRSNFAEEGIDYKIENQSLHISKKYLAENDISQMYVSTMSKLFEEQTKFFTILQLKQHVINLYEKETELSTETQKELTSIYKDFASMIEKNSFKAGYIIVKTYDDVISVDEVLISKFIKEKDLKLKKEMYLHLYELLEQPKVKNVLIFKELMYSKINLFLDGTSFFLPANLKLPIEDCYKKDFSTPLIDSFTCEKPKKKRCIECAEPSYDVKSISFMVDTTDDVARKKSAYWNCKPDAFVCPTCAFIYTFVPLGFAFLGQDTVFINNNNSIESLIRIMETYRDRANLNAKGSMRSRLYQAFTSDKIDMLSNKINNVQVVVKSANSNHYSLNILSKDMVKKLRDSKNCLKFIEKKYIKNGKEFISVYDNIFENILNNRSQYLLINKYIKLELSTGSSTNYIMNILKLELIFRGGINVDNLKKNVDIAFAVGKEMRYKLTDSVKDKDIDNSLRGLVYKLVNALSVENRDDFMNSVIRIYSGKSIPIPYIFKETYESDQMFKAVGTGFILGLKYSKYEGKSNNEEEQYNG